MICRILSRNQRQRLPIHVGAFRLKTILFVAGLTLIVTVASSRTLRAQTLWEVSPYKIQVWLTLERHPEIPTTWQDLPLEVSQLAQTMVGSPWTVESQTTPAAHRRTTLQVTPPNAVEFLNANAELVDHDKLMIVSVTTHDERYVLTVRELDIATRVWSDAGTRTVREGANLSHEIVTLMCDVFVPLVKIMRVEEKEVSAYVRAGALSRPADSIRKWTDPTDIRKDDFLRPFIRKRDRDGKVRDDGIEAVKYTVLMVKERIAGTIICETFSGYRQPFRTRRSSRVDQLALVARGRADSTLLRVHDRKDEKRSLAGYDVYARKPGSEVSDLIGRTDWNGQAIIPKSDSPVRILFIKSGSQVLAKLPVVPGLRRKIEVGLRNDEARLEAEGLLIGIQESLVDLVARREILSARIKRRIEEKKFDEAADLLDKLQDLPSSDAFLARVNERKKQLTVKDDESVQNRIDQLFNDTRQLFSTYLDPNRVQQLRDQLANARSK